MTSFQYEGMVIVDIAARISKDIRVITLDTGRLPAETFDMIEAVRARYGVAIEVVSPDAAELESMVSRLWSKPVLRIGSAPNRVLPFP